MKNKEYDPVEVEGRLKEAIDLIGSIDIDKLPQEPDTICLSCGRSVLVEML